MLVTSAVAWWFVGALRLSGYGSDAAVYLNFATRGELDLAIGGFTDDNPRKKDLGFTRPYVETPKKGGGKESHVFAVPRGENRWLSELETHLAKHRKQAASALPQATPAPQ